MRLSASKNDAGKPRLFARLPDQRGDQVVDLSAAGLPDSLDALLRQGDAGMAAAKAAISKRAHCLPLAGIHYLPPVLAPSKAFARLKWKA